MKYKIALLVFKCINNLAPDYLKDMITLRQVIRRSSRLDDDFFILKIPPKCNFSKTEAAFSRSGPKIWNDLPYEIRSLSSLNVFKSGVAELGGGPGGPWPPQKFEWVGQGTPLQKSSI